MYKAVICWFCWEDENKISGVVARYKNAEEIIVHVCQKHKARIQEYDFSDNSGEWSPILIDVEDYEHVESE